MKAIDPPHYDAEVCIMTKFANLISGKWKSIILYLIERDINRFSLIRHYAPKISKKVLTEQLRELEEDGLIKRIEIKSKAPKVVCYELTEKGTSFRKLIDGIILWSMSNLRDDITESFILGFIEAYPDKVKDISWLNDSE